MAAGAYKCRHDENCPICLMRHVCPVCKPAPSSVVIEGMSTQQINAFKIDWEDAMAKGTPVNVPTRVVFAGINPDEQEYIDGSTTVPVFDEHGKEIGEMSVFPSIIRIYDPSAIAEALSTKPMSFSISSASEDGYRGDGANDPDNLVIDKPGEKYKCHQCNRVFDDINQIVLYDDIWNEIPRNAIHEMGFVPSHVLCVGCLDAYTED